MKKLNFMDQTSEEKLRRIKVRGIADDFRMTWAKKGLFDIFEILENESILIRKPLNTTEFSGFTTYLDNNFIVFLNASFTLGHERFSAAHELGHLVMHKDKLEAVNLLIDKEAEREANLFAVELLMPVMGVEEMFYKLIDVAPKDVKARHIIKMHQYFKVSYKTMLKRLIYLDLCEVGLYDVLVDYCSLENAALLQKLTNNDGYDQALILPSKKAYISREYEEIIRKNYESKKISFKRFSHLIGFINKTPEAYGYEVLND